MSNRVAPSPVSVRTQLSSPLIKHPPPHHKQQEEEKEEEMQQQQKQKQEEQQNKIEFAADSHSYPHHHPPVNIPKLNIHSLLSPPSAAALVLPPPYEEKQQEEENIHAMQQRMIDSGQQSSPPIADSSPLFSAADGRVSWKGAGAAAIVATTPQIRAAQAQRSKTSLSAMIHQHHNRVSIPAGSNWEKELEHELHVQSMLPSSCNMVDERFVLRDEFKDAHPNTQFVYALQLRTFDPNFIDSAEAFEKCPAHKKQAFKRAAKAKRNFTLVFEALRDVLAGKPDPKTGETPYGDGCQYLGYILRGKYDPGHSYIQVGASLRQLEELAETVKMSMQGLNDDFHPFDTDLKPGRQRFAHPQDRVCPSEIDAFYAIRSREPRALDDVPPVMEMHAAVKPDPELEKNPETTLAKRQEKWKEQWLRDRIEKQINKGITAAQLLNLASVKGDKPGLARVQSNLTSSRTPAADPANKFSAAPVSLARRDGFNLTVIAAPHEVLPPDFVIPECKCDIFVPYQKEELVRRLIERALDNVLSTLDQEKSVGNGLRELKRRKVLTGIFPLHYELDTQFYKMSRQDVIERFCQLKTCWVSAFSFQANSNVFVTWMRDYFGEKIAMYFAFLHFYNSCTVWLALLGLAPAIAQYAQGADNVGVVFYCVMIMMWAALFVKFWNRQSNDYAFKWNMLDYEKNEEEMDSFLRSLSGPDGAGNATYGFYEREGRWVDMTDFAIAAKKQKDDYILRFVPRNHIDTSGRCPGCLFNCPKIMSCPVTQMDRAQLNANIWRYAKEACGWSGVMTIIILVLSFVITLTFLKVVLATFITPLGAILAGVANGVTIMVLDAVYRIVAIKVTEWENHRTVTQFEEKLTAKCFVFQFVNSYFSLFYIAFFKQWYHNSGYDKNSLFSDPCLDGGGHVTDHCLNELSTAVGTIIATRLAISLFTERFLPRYLTRISLAQLRFQAKVFEKMQAGMDLTAGIAGGTVKAMIGLGEGVLQAGGDLAHALGADTPRPDENAKDDKPEQDKAADVEQGNDEAAPMRPNPVVHESAQLSAPPKEEKHVPAPPNDPPAIPAPPDAEAAANKPRRDSVFTSAAKDAGQGVLDVAGGVLQIGGKALNFTTDVFDKITSLGDFDKMSLEYQAIQPKYAINRNVLGTFNDYNELVIGYGYMVMFAAAFPIAPAVMLVHNVIQNSTNGFKLIKNYQKPKYYGATDIGMFWYLLVFLTIMSVATNTAIICYTSTQLDDQFPGVTPIDRLAAIFVLEHIFGFIIYLILVSLSDWRPSLREKLAFNEQVKNVDNDYAEYMQIRQTRHDEMVRKEAERIKLHAAHAENAFIHALQAQVKEHTARDTARKREEAAHAAADPHTSLLARAASLHDHSVPLLPSVVPSAHADLADHHLLPMASLSEEETQLLEEFKKDRALKQSAPATAAGAVAAEPAHASSPASAASPMETAPSPSAVLASPAATTPANNAVSVPPQVREVEVAAPLHIVDRPASITAPDSAASSSAITRTPLQNTTSLLRQVSLFDPVSRDLIPTYTQSSSSNDVFFPFTVPELSKLDGIELSDPIIIGERQFRLVIGKQVESESVEFTLRYESGPLPYVCSAFLVAKRYKTNSVGLYRTLNYVFTTHTGFGYPHFASLSELRTFGCYKPSRDSLTVGLVLPSNDWMSGAANSNKVQATSAAATANAATDEVAPAAFPSLLVSEPAVPVLIDRQGSHHFPPHLNPALDDAPISATPTATTVPTSSTNAARLAQNNPYTKRQSMSANLPRLDAGLRTPQFSSGPSAWSDPIDAEQRRSPYNERRRATSPQRSAIPNTADPYSVHVNLRSPTAQTMDPTDSVVYPPRSRARNNRPTYTRDAALYDAYQAPYTDSAYQYSTAAINNASDLSYPSRSYYPPVTRLPPVNNARGMPVVGPARTGPRPPSYGVSATAHDYANSVWSPPTHQRQQVTRVSQPVDPTLMEVRAAAPNNASRFYLNSQAPNINQPYY